MSQEADEYTRLLQGRLRDRLGDRRYGEVFDAILANLEAYAVGRGGPVTVAPVASVLRVPGHEDELDEETRRLLTSLLDHVLRQVTGAVL